MDFAGYNNAIKQYAQGREAEDGYSSWQGGVGIDQVGQSQNDDPGRNYAEQYLNSMPKEQQQEYWQMYQQHQADKDKSFTGRLGSIMKGIPLMVGTAGVGGALGGLNGLFGGAAEAGAAGIPELGLAEQTLGSVYTNPAFTSFPSVDPGVMSGAYNNPAFTAIPGLEGGNMIAGGAAGGASGVQDFFKGLTDQVREKPLDSLIGGARAISSIGDLWSTYKQNQDYGNLAGGLMSMFGDDSAYARQLRKELQRRDAASGRRSQYGPRSVELQARLAELNSRNAGTLANIYQQQGTNRDNMVKGGLNLLKGTGAMDWLDNKLKAPLAQLFGG